MELEKLNTTQVVLLTLLVSFVTSIATGIATVSLMENAPADVTRVISRIIEQPIQTITPGGRDIVTETVVVREGELIAQAVSRALPSIVRIYEETRSDLAFVGFGVLVTVEGRVMTASGILEHGDEYVIVLHNGTQVTAEETEESGTRFLQIVSNDEVLPELTQASFAPYDVLALGQSVISIGGGASASISAGIISELVPASAESQNTPLVRAGVQSAQLSPGSPLIDTEGRVVGLLYNADERTFFPTLLQSPVDAE